MKLLIAAPTGYNTRELLLPLKELLSHDATITQVVVVTPAAPYARDLFADFGERFMFVAHPGTAAACEALLRTHSPTVIVTPTNGLEVLDTPLLQAGRALSIPTCTFVSSWDNVYKMERALRYGQDYVVTDYFAVWNNMMRDHLLRIYPDVTPERVAIVGAPRFDYFQHTDRIPSRAALFSYLNFTDTSRQLLHAATTELYPFGYILRALQRALHRAEITHPLHLYASVHPGGDLARHQSYTAYGATVRYSFGRREQAPLASFRYLPTEAEIYYLVALFKHTSVLVNQSSTVAIESMLADVPVVSVKYGQRFDWWRWRRSMVYRDFQQHYRDILDGGGTTIVTRERDFIAAVERSLREPALRRAERLATATRLLTYTDGSASQRLLDFIKKIPSQ